MDGGYNISPLSAGAWNAGGPSQIWATGGKATRTGTGVVAITLSQPCADTNISCTVTRRGGSPTTPVYFSVEQTSDTVKTVKAYSTDDNSLVDTSFDWNFVRGAQTPNL